MQIFFRVVHFYKTHAVRLSTLKLMTANQLSIKMRLQRFCRNEQFYFLGDKQPGASVLFSFARFQPAAQNGNKR